MGIRGWRGGARKKLRRARGLLKALRMRASNRSVHAVGRRPAGVLAALALAAAAWAAAPAIPPLEPAAALASFRLEPGLRIELVAAEPAIVDPVAFVFDDRGRLFVAEGRGYPDPVEGGGRTSLGRLVCLEDRDGDGRFEHRTVFADGLGYINGLAVWRGGLWVTAAPDLLYLKDNDGDGAADERRVALTGFEASKTAQLRVSHPTRGPDGRYYVTSGLNGGKVTSPEHPDRPAVAFTARDGRFDPGTLMFENTGGRGQFGLAFDAFGRRFVTSNRHPVLQVMLEPWHLARHPHLGFNETTQEVSKVEAQAKVFRLSNAAISADYIPSLMGTPHAGTFTSACGLIVFGGDALGADYVGNAFICEPAQNLIQRQVFRPEGASWRSDAVPAGREFLATTDVWFRPVFLGEGPDGALYVADMYRREIDHPRYVPEESRGGLDFEGGKDRGRIYRIVRDGTGARAFPRTTRTETYREWLADLESPQRWWRDRAARLLADEQTPLRPELSKVAERARLPEARVAALWVLHNRRELVAEHLEQAARDPHAGVREQVPRLIAEMPTVPPPLANLVMALAADPDAGVRFQVALALAKLDSPTAIPALAAIARADGADRWSRAAVLSGIAGRETEFQRAFMAGGPRESPAFAAVMEHVGRMVGAGGPPERSGRFLTDVVVGPTPERWAWAAALGVIQGSRGAAVKRLTADSAGAAVWKSFVARAAEMARDAGTAVGGRLPAIALLGYADAASAGPVLTGLLAPRHPAEVQLQAVKAIESIGDPETARALVAAERWRSYTPQVREAVLAAVTGKPALVPVLFDALDAVAIAPTEISSVKRGQLLKHALPAVRERAAAAFRTLEGGDRMAVYRSFRDVAGSATADAKAGAAAFARSCSACHTYRGNGGRVGPDLTGLKNQPADAILLHILVPNYEVLPSYQTLAVTTRDGRTLSGWLAAESEFGLQLRTAAGAEESIRRDEIATLAATGVSLMPDGLEQTMTRDELAGLIAFLKQPD